MAPMRKVVLATLLASSHSEQSCASGGTGEETSLMQDLVKRNRQSKMEMTLADGVDLKSKQGRHDSLGKLVKTAEHMVKNGATPDVVTFVSKTITSITEGVMPEIMDEHEQDQALLNNWLKDFDDAHAKFEEHALTERPDASSVDQLSQCRKEESKACGRARNCQMDLEKLWDAYVKAENDVRKAHGDIHQHMCPDPQSFPVQEWAPKWMCPNWPEIRNSLPETATQDYCPSGDDCPEGCNEVTCTEADGVRTCSGAYERIYIDEKATKYREDLKSLFETYMEAKSVLEGGDDGESQGFWNVYTRKLEECANLDENLEDLTPHCDEMQVKLEDDACHHDGEVRVRRKNFGKSLDEAGRLYRIAIHGRDSLEHYNTYTKPYVDENGNQFLVPFCPDFNDASLRGDNWDTHKFMDNQSTTDFRHSDGTAQTREDIEGGICRLEYDRKREVETLHIVTCLLTKVNQHVTMSIETGEDCITETTHPDQVKREIDECHMIAMGGADVDVENKTWSGSYDYNKGILDIDYGKQPLPKIPPRPQDTPCTQEFVTFEQGMLQQCAAPRMCLAATDSPTLFHSETYRVACENPKHRTYKSCSLPKKGTCYGQVRLGYTGEDREEWSDWRTVAGEFECTNTFFGGDPWEHQAKECQCKPEARQNGGGIDHCDATRPDPADKSYTEDEYVCMLHQSDLKPGEQDADTFLCATGGKCIDVIGRCNGVDNCGDGSDEQNCLEGEANLPMLCSDGPSLAVKSTSGRHSKVTKITKNSGAFFDRDGAKGGAENPRDYNYIAGKNKQEHRPAGNDNAGSEVISFDPKLEKLSWVKYSNDDKFTPRDHVMLKVSVPSPTRVYVNVVEKVGQESAHDGWTPAGWKHETANNGVVFKSHFQVMGDEATTWGNALRVEHFQDGTATITEEFKGKVYSKVFPAGDIMLRGNGGKDGSYLVFLEDLANQCWKGEYSRWAVPAIKPEPPVVEEPVVEEPTFMED